MEQQAMDPRVEALVKLMGATDYVSRLSYPEFAARFLAEHEAIFTPLPAREVDPHAEEFPELPTVHDGYVQAALQGLLANCWIQAETLTKEGVVKDAREIADKAMEARKAGAK